MSFVGFTEQEIDTIVLKKYEKGRDFSRAVDSLIIDSNVTRFWLSNDTLRIAATISTTNLLSSFNYRISIPSTNSIYTITDLYEPQQEGRASTRKIMCGNSIQSCKINGAATQLRFDLLYLKK